MVKKATPPPTGKKKPAPPAAPPTRGSPFHSPALVAARKEAESHLTSYPTSTPFEMSSADKKAEQAIKFETIQRDISSLTAKQRDEIRKTIQSLTKKKLAPTHHSDHELMHQAFRACMREQRLTFPTYMDFKTGHASAAYTKNILIVTKFIDTRFSGISKAERLKLMMILSRCIISYIEDDTDYEGRNTTPLMLDPFGFAVCCAKVDVLIERSFPGYVEAGMIGVLLKSYQ